jgi:biopolymer transport protein ExbD
MAALDREMDDEGVIAEINIIPFVDIVLVLLIIFFMKATSSGRTVQPGRDHS